MLALVPQLFWAFCYKLYTAVFISMPIKLVCLSLSDKSIQILDKRDSNKHISLFIKRIYNAHEKASYRDA